MTEAFTGVLEQTLQVEGGYSNHKNDLGGATQFGITEALARRYGYRGSMRELTLEQAARIYHREFWEPLMLEKVHGLAPSIAHEVFDTSVNMGRAWGPLFLQQCLNALNQRGGLYPDLKEDGDLGPLTVGALKAYLKARGGEGVIVLNRALNALQGARYIAISRARDANEDFTYGWFRTRVSIV